MTPEQQAERIREIYEDAIAKLTALRKEREELIDEKHHVIKDYIKSLESQKMEAIRASLGLPASTNQS